MKKNLILASLLALTLAGHTQPSSKTSFWDKVFIGGGVGGQFGSDFTYVNVSPTIGYWITNHWSAGVGFTYQYLQSKIYNYSTSIYGPKAFTRYHFLKFLFAHAEFEYLFLKYRDDVNTTPISVTSPNLLLGGGASYEIGGTATAYVMILYNVLQNQYTPYSNPVIRFGVDIGL